MTYSERLKPELHPCRYCGMYPSILPLGNKWYLACSDSRCPCTATVVSGDLDEGIDIWNSLNRPKDPKVS